MATVTEAIRRAVLEDESMDDEAIQARLTAVDFAEPKLTTIRTCRFDCLGVLRIARELGWTAPARTADRTAARVAPMRNRVTTGCRNGAASLGAFYHILPVIGDAGNDRLCSDCGISRPYGNSPPLPDTSRHCWN